MQTSATAAAILARVDAALVELAGVDVTDELLAALPAGPALAAVLLGIDPALLDPERQLSFLEASQRMINALDARRDRGIVAFAGSNPRHTLYWVNGDERRITDARAAEIALALHWSEGFTRQRIDSARAQQQLPSTTDAFDAGLISSRTTDAITTGLATLTGPLDDAIACAIAGACAPEQVDDLRGLRRQMVAEFDARVSAYALQHNPLRIGDKIRSTIAALDPVGAASRRAIAARTKSNVEFRVLADGLGQLTATMPSEQALACMRAIDDAARDAALVDLDDPVGLRRARVLFQFVTGSTREVDPVDSNAQVPAPHLGAMTGGEAATASVSATSNSGTTASPTGATPDAIAGTKRARNGVGVHLDVVMDLPSFLGLADTPAMVVGAGPLPAYAARELLADSAYIRIRRILTDPVTGHRLDTGVQRYLLTETERERILSRDQHCRFPDCNAPAIRCECDHAVPYQQGGVTATANLGAACKRHHQHKTHAGWQITSSSADGSCTWRSPLGRTYRHEAQPVLPWAVNDHVVVEAAERVAFDAAYDATHGQLPDPHGCPECTQLTGILRQQRDHAWRNTRGALLRGARVPEPMVVHRSWLERHAAHTLKTPNF